MDWATFAYYVRDRYQPSILHFSQSSASSFHITYRTILHSISFSFFLLFPPFISTEVFSVLNILLFRIASNRELFSRTLLHFSVSLSTSLPRFSSTTTSQNSPSVLLNIVFDLIKIYMVERKLSQRFLIFFSFQFLLDRWGEELNSRSGAEKMGTRGKFALATYTQTQQYLKPLLRKLKSKTLPEDISDSLTEITKHILDRNYIAVSFQ